MSYFVNFAERANSLKDIRDTDIISFSADKRKHIQKAAEPFDFYLSNYLVTVVHKAP